MAIRYEFNGNILPQAASLAATAIVALAVKTGVNNENKQDKVNPNNLEIVWPVKLEAEESHYSNHTKPTHHLSIAEQISKVVTPYVLWEWDKVHNCEEPNRGWHVIDAGGLGIRDSTWVAYGGER